MPSGGPSVPSVSNLLFEEEGTADRIVRLPLHVMFRFVSSYLCMIVSILLVSFFHVAREDGHLQTQCRAILI